MSEVARADLAARSIAVAVGADPDHDAGFCLVMVDDEGERTFVTAKGAELSLRRADLDGVGVTAGDYLYLSGYNLVYPEIGDTVAGWVHDLPEGVVVAFDPGARVSDVPVSLRAAVMARTNWLLCNEAEARALTGDSDVEAVGGHLARDDRGRRGRDPRGSPRLLGGHADAGVRARRGLPRGRRRHERRR